MDKAKVFFIAGKLVKRSGRFILKLSEDWAYREEYKKADRRLNGLAWVT